MFVCLCCVNYFSMSLSLRLGLCLSPDSRLCRRAMPSIAVDTGVPKALSCKYVLPVSGVDTFRADACEGVILKELN